jgi:uncharacterized protein (TIGR03083 family)
MNLLTRGTPQRNELRRAAMDRTVAMRLAATEYDRFADLLEALDEPDWSRQTDCTKWDVRALSCHVLGMAEGSASMREGGRQRKAARRAGGVFIHALTDLQVRERAALASTEITRQFRAVGPRAARGRKNTPGFIRKRRMPVPQPVGGQDEWWALGYLIDVVLTRDVWMHRIDLCHATARRVVLTHDHDGVIIADVVAEWADRHGQPYRLQLTGPAGGSWSAGIDGPVLEIDAIEFCRTLAGRTPGSGLLDTEVPF